MINEKKNMHPKIKTQALAHGQKIVCCYLIIIRRRRRRYCFFMLLSNIMLTIIIERLQLSMINEKKMYAP